MLYLKIKAQIFRFKDWAALGYVSYLKHGLKIHIKIEMLHLYPANQGEKQFIFLIMKTKTFIIMNNFNTVFIILRNP